jgi:hypothetical protein
MMTDAERRAIIRRIGKISKKWLKMMGLMWWTVNLNYTTETRDTGSGYQAIAWVNAKWQYMTADVYFSLPIIVDKDDEEIEEVVRHELCHILVNEMREQDEDRLHEERVCTTLASALGWTFIAGKEEGMKCSS